MKEILSSSKIKEFALNVFKVLFSYDKFKSLELCISEKEASDGAKKYSFNDGSESIPSCFIAPFEKVKKRNTPIQRWFEERGLFIKKDEVFLSDQWYGDNRKNSTAILPLQHFVNQYYKNVYKIEIDQGRFSLLKVSEKTEENLMNENSIEKKDSFFFTYQAIFFGAPGTGKSHKIDYNLFKDKDGNPIEKGIKEIPEDRKFRTTFHPDYDYAQFVGAYKPRKKDDDQDKITYSFVPQVFAKSYAAAWKQYFAAGNASTAENQVYLVIEEINRGNCAQIFGDIFQLLDRDSEGFSQYSIDADCDFATWLKEDFILKNVWSDYEAKVGDGKLKLPPNLNILATMNTSDQSLFPMDSAFKRRFDWEYVPIKYAKDSDCGDDWKADEFKIVIGDSMYMWLDFLKKVNADIYDATQSEDKQMGEFFIKPKSDDLKIAFNEFRSKVLFYLWDSVYKDETERQAVFHFPYGDGDGKINSVTFQSLFGKDAEAIVNKIMENLKVEKVTA